MQARVGGHRFLTTLVAAYENYSRKRPALHVVTDSFFASQGCPLTRASTVIVSYAEIEVG